MSWKMKCMDKKYLTKSLDLVERIFTESENAESGNTVRRLVEEIRSKRFYLPELELIVKGGLPAPECLMVKELAEGSLKTIKGIVDYSDYQYLT